jgi:hypothetical protein
LFNLNKKNASNRTIKELKSDVSELLILQNMIASNRTIKELKFIVEVIIKVIFLYIFQSHHKGIEIKSCHAICQLAVNFQSHHKGIEIIYKKSDEE